MSACHRRMATAWMEYAKNAIGRRAGVGDAFALLIEAGGGSAQKFALA
jgi:hypothetical protein